jgi:hypothetical protein
MIMAKLSLERPAPAEYASFHAGYVALVPDGDVLKLLERQGRQTTRLLRSVGERKSRHRYAPGKWSIREVVGHVIDAERVFTYRALRFARADATPLPGFDENQWGGTSNADSRTLKELTAELASVRAATLAMFRGFTATEFARTGTASGQPMSVRGITFVTAGHERHHVNVLRERYGI